MFFLVNNKVITEFNYEIPELVKILNNLDIKM